MHGRNVLVLTLSLSVVVFVSGFMLLGGGKRKGLKNKHIFDSTLGYPGEGPTDEYEEYAEIDGYANYRFYKDGRCRHEHSHNFLIPRPKHNGYTEFRFSNRLTDHLRVGRAILTAFKGPPPNDTYTCDHIDRNIHNNHIDNLRWATREEQANNKGKKRKIGYISRKSYKVEQIDINTQAVIKIWDSPSIAAYALNVNVKGIMENIRVPERKKTAHGYIWRRASDINPSKTPVVNLENEIWKQIDGALAGYMVSNMGRTAKMDEDIMYIRHDPKLCPCRTVDGYYMWHYRDEQNKDANKLVHRIVAHNFVTKPAGYDDTWTVDHINGDKTENAAYNLQWMTIADNVAKANRKTE
jgi:hypothetical protein